EKKEPEKKEEKSEEKTEKPAPAEKKEKETAPPQEKNKPPARTEEARVKASPVARRVAAELGVDLASVKGTGPEGRVTETDVRAAAKSVAAGADRGGAKPQPKPAHSIRAGESARLQ